MNIDENRYRDLAESLSEVIYVANPRTFQATYINRAVEDLYGYTVDEWLRNPDLWENTIHPEDHKRVLQELTEYLNKDESSSIEYRIIRKDGTIRWVIDRVSFERRKDGTLVSMDGVMYDITEEKKYKDLVELSANMIFSLDLSGNFLFVNQQWEKIIGYPAHNVLGTDGFNFIHPDDLPLITEEFSKVLNGEVVENIEFRSKIEDGTYKNILMNASPVHDSQGKTISIIGTAIDITKRKQTEQELRFLSSITEQVTDSVIVTDTDHRITFINEAAEQLFGYKNEELIGLTPDILNADHLSDQIHENIYGIVSSGNVWIGEVLNKKKDGSIFLSECKISPLRDKQGQINSYIGIQHDITENKKTERELEESLGTRSELIDASNDIIELIDKEGNLLVINEAGAQRFGRDQSELIGLNIWDILPKGLSKARKVQADEVLKTGRPIRFEDQDRGRWFGHVYCPIVDEEGSVIRIAIVSRDVDDRMRARQQLEESEENFRNSMDKSPLGIRIVNSKGELLYVNQAMLDVYGFEDIDEMRNTPMSKRLTPTSYADYLTMQEDLKKGIPFPSGFEIEIIRKDGNTRTLVVNRAEVIWNGEVQFQYLCQDITDRKHTEEAFRESEANFRNSMDSSPLGIRIMNQEEEILYANKALLDIYGYEDIEEMRNTQMKDRLTPTSYTEFRERMDNQRKGRFIPPSYEVDIVRKDGEIRTLNPHFPYQTGLIGIFLW